VLVKTDRVVSWSAELDAHLGDILVAEQLDASRALGLSKFVRPLSAGSG